MGTIAVIVVFVNIILIDSNICLEKGNVMEKLQEINIKTLPPYIKESLDWYRKAIESKKQIEINDAWCDLYGSINSGQWSGDISEGLANYLRDKYLY